MNQTRWIAIDLTQLTLTVERLLDADLLFPQDAQHLIACIDAARQALIESDTRRFRQQAGQFVSKMEKLLLAGNIDENSGREMMERVERILHHPQQAAVVTQPDVQWWLNAACVAPQAISRRQDYSFRTFPV